MIPTTTLSPPQAPTAGPAPSGATAAGQAAAGLASAGAQAAVTAVASAVGSPVVGKVAGAVVGSKTGRRAIAAVVAVALVGVLGMAASISMLLNSAGVMMAGTAEADNQAPQDSGAGDFYGSDGTAVHLDPAQETAARAIVSAGQAMNVPTYGLVVAVAAAMGQPQGLIDPTFDAAGFYDQLLAVPDWQSKDVATLAQAILPSPFPDEYTQTRSAAAAVVAQITGSTVGLPSAGGDVIGGWTFPLPPGTWKRTSPFSASGRRDPVTGGWEPVHDGVDWAVRTGTPVGAVAAGTVDKTGFDPAGMGNYVWVNHGGGLRTRYQHLSAISVSVGQQVAAGQTVGLSGSTGKSTGPHLHFSVYVNGTATDPEPFLRSKGVL